MIALKSNPVDIDVPIQRLQQHLYTELLDLWSLEEGQYSAYGRCYRNQTKDGYVPEVYDGNDEYREVFCDDRLAALSFFGVGDTIPLSRKIRAVIECPVHLVMFVQLDQIKNLTHRSDVEARRDVQTLVHERFGFGVQAIKTGIDNVFSEYSGTRRSDWLKFRDMHPFHVFRLDMLVNYTMYQGCELEKTQRAT